MFENLTEKEIAERIVEQRYYTWDLSTEELVKQYNKEKLAEMLELLYRTF